jgi:hypothetical protein
VSKTNSSSLALAVDVKKARRSRRAFMTCRNDHVLRVDQTAGAGVTGRS